MRPVDLGVPLAIPVKVIRAEVVLQCPQCLRGVGFLANQPIQPGTGIHVVCPSCNLKLGVKFDFVKIDAPRRLIL